MKKRIFISALCIILCLIFVFSFSGCVSSSPDEAVGIRTIKKTATDGLVDTYTIYFTDGTKTTFEITNGKDGKDGQNGLNGVDGKDGQDGEDLVGITPVSIVSIKKTSTQGLVDTYTIYYSDGSESTFEITNGKDGKDGQNGLNGVDGKDGENGEDGQDGKDGEDGSDITALELYETYKSIYGDDLTYAEFLSLYLTFDDETSSGHNIINSCLRSTGKVYAQFTESDGIAAYAGACVIYRIDADYTYLITNYHVIYDKAATTSTKTAEKVYCYLYGSEDYPTQKVDISTGNLVYDYGDYAIECEYIGGAITSDLAIIKAKTEDVLAINADAQAITFAENYYVGETAIAIGNPNDMGISVTEGIVSIDNDFISLDIDGTSRKYRSIRIDTALYGGNSGGGLFNARGELIGIANAGNTTEQNINFAIPIEIVKATVESIMYYHEDGDSTTNGAYKIALGVTVVAANSKYVYDAELGFGSVKEDLLIDDLTTTGIAYKIGLEAGDIITSMVINGEKFELDRYFDIGDLLITLTSGEKFYFFYIDKDTGTEQKTSVYSVSDRDLSKIP